MKYQTRIRNIEKKLGIHQRENIYFFYDRAEWWKDVGVEEGTPKEVIHNLLLQKYPLYYQFKEMEQKVQIELISKYLTNRGENFHPQERRVLNVYFFIRYYETIGVMNHRIPYMDLFGT
jgi:hypothetical protein